MKYKIQLKIFLITSFSLLIIALTVMFMLNNGIILFNNPSTKKYPVRGVDVSRYQGNIDWKVLSHQDIYFAFIKATEGSQYVDPFFKFNYQNALKSNLRIGAYHFFRTDSKGGTQAQNFIATVEKSDKMLPPVIDFEIDPDLLRSNTAKKAIRVELSTLLNRLEEHYGLKPIIYTTEELYDLGISGYYTDYDIWIRSVFTQPSKQHNQEWIFWQYTNREQLKGYDGVQKYIDMNVFRGSVDEFNNYSNKDSYYQQHEGN